MTLQQSSIGRKGNQIQGAGSLAQGPVRTRHLLCHPVTAAALGMHCLVGICVWGPTECNDHEGWDVRRWVPRSTEPGTQQKLLALNWMGPGTNFPTQQILEKLLGLSVVKCDINSALDCTCLWTLWSLKIHLDQEQGRKRNRDHCSVERIEFLFQVIEFWKWMVVMLHCCERT